MINGKFEPHEIFTPKELASRAYRDRNLRCPVHNAEKAWPYLTFRCGCLIYGKVEKKEQYQSCEAENGNQESRPA